MIEIHIDKMSLDSVNNTDCKNDYIEVTEIREGALIKSANIAIPFLEYHLDQLEAVWAWHFILIAHLKIVDFLFLIEQ